jgi:twitching motility protein PilT
MFITDLLITADRKNASDLHLESNQVPIIRVNGSLISLDEYPEILSKQDITCILKAIFSQNQLEIFQKKHNVDLAYGFVNGENQMIRCRINVFEDFQGPAMAVRIFPKTIPTIRNLRLPLSLETLAEKEQGLLLVTGATGSGKSTTLAALLDYINETKRDNIITIEDPIEYVHVMKKSIVRQREVGTHVENFEEGLQSALRQDPNVILIGELRNRETIRTALRAAETGHLVMSTLHSGNVIEAVDRLLQYFSDQEQNEMRNQIANSLEGVITQQLLPRVDGGRIAALEIMLRTTAITNTIRNGQNYQLKTYMQGQSGMQTMEDALINLKRRNLI